MRTIIVPLENPRSKTSKDESKVDSVSVKLDIEVTESKKRHGESPSKAPLRSCLKDKEGTEKNESVYNMEKDIPPPYVIWAQFMGYGQEEHNQPLDYVPESRNFFVKQVFLLVLMMILLAAIIAVAINTVPPLYAFFAEYGAFVYLPALVMLVILNYAIMCSACTRKAPCSYICLLLTSICVGLICGGLTMWKKTHVIYIALVVTAIVVFVCFCLACTSFDFTKYMLFIIMISVATGALLFIYVICNTFLGIVIKPLHMALLFIAIIAEMIMLAMELQMILGGRTVELGVDEYAAGAFLVFMSIFSIFAKLLQLTHLFDEL